MNLELLSNPENEKLYNTHIDSVDVHTTFGNMFQTTIYHKELKSMSAWYRKRWFDLIHYSFEYNDWYYIIERSVDTSKFEFAPNKGSLI